MRTKNTELLLILGLIIIWGFIPHPLNSQNVPFNYTEISRFADSQVNSGFYQLPVVNYPWLYVPNNYGIKVCQWDSLAQTITPVRLVGLTGYVQQLVRWEHYLFASIWHTDRHRDLEPADVVLYKLDISAPQQPVVVDSLCAEADLKEYTFLNVVNGVLLGSSLVNGTFTALNFIDPATLQIRHQYPLYYRYGVIGAERIITRSASATRFMQCTVDLENGLGIEASHDLGYVVGSFPEIIRINESLVATQCGEGFRLWQRNGTEPWQLLSFQLGTFSSLGFYCNGYLVFSQRSAELISFQLYDISNPYQIVQSSCPYPPGVDGSPAPNMSMAVGSFIFHNCTVWNMLCLKLNDGQLAFSASCYEYNSYCYAGFKFENYILQPMARTGIVCFDISDPYHPQQSFTLFPGNAAWIDINGNYLWARLFPVQGNNSTEVIYNISNLAEPVLIYSMPVVPEISLFFNKREPQCFYKLNFSLQRVEKYQINGSQVSLVCTLDLPVPMTALALAEGICYTSSASGTVGHDLYCFSGFEQNAPQLDNIYPALVPEPGWLYPYGDYAYLRDPFINTGYITLFRPQNSFSILNTDSSFMFRDYLCTGDEAGFSLYDISGLPSGFQQPLGHLTQASQVMNADADENYLYLFCTDNIAIFSWNGSEGSDPQIPAAVRKLDCYPNPFSSNITFETKIKVDPSSVLDIYNLKGQRVASLTPDTAKQNLTSFNWKGFDKNGQQVSSGIYLAVLRSGSKILAKSKVSYIKP